MIIKLLHFRLNDHVQGADNNPLLIFPEGTCVNNHYSVMFKKVLLKFNRLFINPVFALSSLLRLAFLVIWFTI